MNKIYITIVFLFCLNSIYSQAGMWTWVNGDTASSTPPHFGTQGVADSLNHPYGSYEGCEWTDKEGNFWFFESGSPTGLDNDLWKYDPLINMWTWVKGNGVANDTGSYGTQGVSSSTNLPPSRGYGIASWTDTTGNLWMYGGNNYSVTFNDLWKYDIATNNWTWVNGSNIPNQPPVYGTKGVSSPLNTPGARNETSCAWVDNNNNLWLFGGGAPSGAQYNSLWKYSIATNQWTWMKGADTVYAVGVYGIKGQEDSLNTPSARYAYTKWKDNNGNFWMFGGSRYWSGSYYLNDLWKYNVTTNNWTWIKGPNNVPLDSGNTGLLCEMDTAFNPISRFESRSCWKDNNGNLWMFGGLALNTPSFPYALWLNDMWMYNIPSNEWTLVWSDVNYNQHGNFGIKGVTTPCNDPLGRMGSVSWYNTNTNSMYLFGGYQYLLTGSGNNRSEMWKYEIQIPCNVQHCSPEGIAESSNQNGLSIYPNPFSYATTLVFAEEQKNTVIRITNLLGQEIKRINFTGTQLTIEKGNIQSGIYFVQTTDEQKHICNKKIIIQ